MDQSLWETNIDGAYVHEKFKNAVLAMVPLSIYLQNWGNMINL